MSFSVLALLIIVADQRSNMPQRSPSRAWAERQLLTAAWTSDKKAVQKALLQGADVNYIGRPLDREGSLARRRTTALILASERGDVMLARLLIARGAHPDLMDEDGNTALHQAAMDGEVAMAKLLLDHGANYRLKNRFGNTPLMLDEIGDGVGAAQDYDAVGRLIRHRMASDRIQNRKRRSSIKGRDRSRFRS